MRVADEAEVRAGAPDYSVGEDTALAVVCGQEDCGLCLLLDTQAEFPAEVCGVVHGGIEAEAAEDAVDMAILLLETVILPWGWTYAASPPKCTRRSGDEKCLATRSFTASGLDEIAVAFTWTNLSRPRTSSLATQTQSSKAT
jgi:hypothetical protein